MWQMRKGLGNGSGRKKLVGAGLPKPYIHLFGLTVIVRGYTKWISKEMGKLFSGTTGIYGLNFIECNFNKNLSIQNSLGIIFS